MKGKDILIVILSILVIGLGGFIIYDKLVMDNDKSDVKENKKSEEENKKSEEENKTVEVIDYINYSIDKTGNKDDCVGHGVEVIKIPMFDSDKPGAVALNNKIKDDYVIFIAATKRSEREALYSEYNYEVNYSYEEYKNYISLKMTGLYGPSYCGSGYSYNSYYTYDVEKDVMLNNDDLLNLVNVTKKDLLERVKNDIITNRPELDVDSIVQKVESLLNDNSYNIYISSEGLIKIEIQYEAFSLLTYTYEI